MPDKLIDKDLLKYYDGKLKTQANILQRDTSYILGQFVYRGNIFLKCITAGTTDTTALNLTGVAIGDILTDGTCEWVVFDPFATIIKDWQSGTKYFVGDFVIKNDILYECITNNQDITFNSVKWKAISKDGVNAWQSNKQYALYDLSVEDEDLYLCISPHTSSSDFQTDLDAERWKLIGGGGGSGGDWNQVTKMNVVAPLDVDINIPYTNTFKRPPVEVLKYEQGTTDITTNVLDFGVGDGSKFEVDGVTAKDSPLITFDGVAKPNHDILYSFGTPTQMVNKYYSESEEIDLDDFKVVGEVSLK